VSNEKLPDLCGLFFSGQKKHDWKLASDSGTILREMVAGKAQYYF
jgi:hypothetical protein